MARTFLVGTIRPTFQDLLLDTNQFLITLGTVLIAASGYIINDYFDVKIDLINKPNEVIIGRYIRRRHAMLIHQIFNIAGAVIGYAVSFKVFIVNILAITLLWFYASIFKKKPFVGNFMVAGLTGSSLVVMAVFYTENDLLINIYALFAFGISIIREMIKDMEDIKGDKQYGSSTLPIIWGIQKTKRLLWVIVFLFVMAVILMSLALKNDKLTFTFGLLGLPFLYMAYKLYLADRKGHFAHLSSLCKWIMVLGILSMIVI